MNVFEAGRVAGLIGGDAVDSGGGAYIVEIRNLERGTVLCLGDVGWWAEYQNGEFAYSVEAGSLVRNRSARAR